MVSVAMKRFRFWVYYEYFKNLALKRILLKHTDKNKHLWELGKACYADGSQGNGNLRPVYFM